MKDEKIKEIIEIINKLDEKDKDKVLQFLLTLKIKEYPKSHKDFWE